MAHPLILFGALALSSIGGLGYLNRNAASQPDLTPKLWGDWNARAVLGSMGLLGLVLGGPILSAVGTGLVISAVASWDTSRVWSEGLKQIGAALAPGGAAPQIPAAPNGGANAGGDPLMRWAS